MRVYCPCCGYDTLDTEREYDICSICYWEDDPIQFDDPFYEGGANHISLAQAKENYDLIGACEEEASYSTRPPSPIDRRNPEWKPYIEYLIFLLGNDVVLIKEKIQDIVSSRDIEEILKIRFYFDVLWKNDSSLAEKMCIECARNKKLKDIWPYLYNKLAENSYGNDIDDLFVEFLLNFRNEMPGIGALIDDYYRNRQSK